jgi:hypothetical protein
MLLRMLFLRVLVHRRFVVEGFLRLAERRNRVLDDPVPRCDDRGRVLGIDTDRELLCYRLRAGPTAAAWAGVGAICLRARPEQAERWIAAIVEGPSAWQNEPIGVTLTDDPAVSFNLVIDRGHPEHQSLGDHPIHERRGGRAARAIAEPPHGGEP